MCCAAAGIGRACTHNNASPCRVLLGFNRYVHHLLACPVEYTGSASLLLLCRAMLYYNCSDALIGEEMGLLRHALNPMVVDAAQVEAAAGVTLEHSPKMSARDAADGVHHGHHH